MSGPTSIAVSRHPALESVHTVYSAFVSSPAISELELGFPSFSLHVCPASRTRALLLRSATRIRIRLGSWRRSTSSSGPSKTGKSLIAVPRKSRSCSQLDGLYATSSRGVLLDLISNRVLHFQLVILAETNLGTTIFIARDVLSSLAGLKP